MSIKVTARELSERLEVDYALANNFIKILEKKGLAKFVENRPPKAKGKGMRSSKVYELPDTITIEV